MKKRTGLLFFVILLLVLVAQAHGSSCGDGVTWNLENGVLTVQGTGAMNDGAFLSGDIRATEIRRVDVKEGITHIGANAFQGCTFLEEVVLPGSLTSLGECAFADCPALKRLSLPDGIREIGYDTFGDIPRLETSALFTETGKTLGSWSVSFFLPGQDTEYVFAYSETSEYQGLTLQFPESEDTTTASVVFPEGCECIQEGFFKMMTNLKTARIPSSVKHLSMADFAGIHRDFCIQCDPGSPAEQFALEHGLQFDNGVRKVVGYQISGYTKKLNWIIRNYITPGMSDVQKARVLHNWLTTNCHYDETKTIHDAETLVLKGYGVCESYANAYYDLLKLAGLRCAKFDGTIIRSGENHIWNAVFLNNRWVHIDATWDDPETGPMDPNYPCVTGKENYSYFMLTDSQLAKTHEWGDTYSVDKGRLWYFYEPALKKELYGVINMKNCWYALDWDHKTAAMIEPLGDTLTALNIPAAFKFDGKKFSVVSIDPEACRNYKVLESVTIGANVKTIGKNAFRNCTGLKTIVLNTTGLTAGAVGENAFRNVSKKVTVTCPSSVLKKYRKWLPRKGLPEKAKIQKIQ